MEEDQDTILSETRFVPQQKRSGEARARIMAAAEEYVDEGSKGSSPRDILKVVRSGARRIRRRSFWEDPWQHAWTSSR